MLNQTNNDLIEELNQIKCLSQISAFVKYSASCRSYKLLGTNFVLDVVCDDGYFEMQWIKEENQGFVRPPFSNVTIEDIFEEVSEKVKLELMFHINIFNRSVRIEVE